MEVYERLKIVRKHFKMTQEAFAKSIGLTQTSWGMIEVGKRKVQDRHIKSICTLFNINEQWVRTGDGEMFVQTEASMLDQFAEEYKLTDAEKEVVKYFLELDAEERADILDHIVNIAEVIQNAHSKSKRPNKPDDELTRAEVHQMIDQELDDREKGITSTASTGTNGLKRDKP